MPVAIVAALDNCPRSVLDTPEVVPTVETTSLGFWALLPPLPVGVFCSPLLVMDI
jgi:hypothetical protein